VEVRPATPADLDAVHAIYAHHVLKGLASFEEVPPPREEIARRHREITGQGLPWIVAQYGDRIAGYGYCALYRTRSAYRYSLEDSIYVHHEMHGRGIGTQLLRSFCDISSSDPLSCGVYLETAEESNLGFYERAGFAETGRGRLGRATLWCMYLPQGSR